MRNVIKHCELCEKNKKDYKDYFSYLLSDFPDFFDNSVIGYYIISESEDRIFCKVHPSEKLLTSPLSANEYEIITYVSTDNSFIHAMEELKENDPIEYQLKLSQFKTQLQQQESSKIQNDTTPRCPHCHSTNIKSISGLNRGASIAMWGIFSKKINKSFECLNCKYTW